MLTVESFAKNSASTIKDTPRVPFKPAFGENVLDCVSILEPRVDSFISPYTLSVSRVGAKDKSAL